MSEILRTEHLSKTFKGLKALHDINLSVDSEDIFGIIGPNGAGKTTYFNMITGFYPTEEGKIFFNGEELTGQKIDVFCKKGMARTFQNIRVFSAMSVLENCLVGMQKTIKEPLWSIFLRTGKHKKTENEMVEKAMGILEYLGIDKYANEVSGSLPYGAQRKVEIARALCSDPKLILLDEPTAGMNQNETMGLVELIKGIRKMGPSIIVIEHNMRFMMNLADRIAVLNFGELIACDTPAAIQSNQEVIDAYLGSNDTEG